MSQPRKKTGGRKKGQAVRFPGATVFAKSMGVSYQHVYKVLIGERQSPRVLAAYPKYCAENNISCPL